MKDSLDPTDSFSPKDNFGPKDSFGSDANANIESELNPLEKLMRKVPDFSGYLEKRDRREADQLLRETIVDRLSVVRLQLSRVQEELSQDIVKAIDHAEPLGRVDSKLEGLIGKIKDAPQGYAGFFSPVKVKEDKLDQLYQFDNTMMTHGEQIALDVQALQKAVEEDGDIRGAISQLNRSIQDALDTFSSRNEIITGMA